MRKWVSLTLCCLAMVGVVAAPAGSLPPPAGVAEQPSHFGRMFPDLPAFTVPTAQQLADLAQTMFDPNAAENDNPGVTSGFTYFGQFVDHDLTLDPVPSGVAADPTTIENGRTFRLDLDSVYGGGPSVSPQLYAGDGKHFLVQEPNANGVRDLPRNPDGTAILVESRNDENEIISQLHVAFLKFHNALVDSGLTFEQARQTTIQYYQWVVLHEFLPHIVGQDVLDATLAAGPRLYKPDNPNWPMTPVEFSVAAYRFGHSMVRRAYELNATTGKIQVFSTTVPDLRGGRPVPAGRQIDWGTFVPELHRTGLPVNVSRKVDTLISSGLFSLPIPPAEATGSNVLAFRNMLRAELYSMPSGQDVARAMGLPVITPAELNLGTGFETGTPLWYYILAESGRAGGAKLGPVGARIVAETFVGVLFADRTSILRTGFVPQPPLAPTAGAFSLADFLVDAGVATRP
jgi:hypothetical protein